MAGLVPAIPIHRAQQLPHRDHRDKPGDDEENLVTTVPRRPGLVPGIL